uniref:Uncharacterized protein n=1 Tax=Fagus sylvatica TaxID=28930 RepID=A0A2N9ER76_FAGSY
MAALKGDWNSVEHMDNIQRVISDKGETTLHIAVAANQKEFIQNLLNHIKPDDKLVAVNKVGINAFTYAAATGKLDIVKAMLRINPNFAGTVKPLLMATLFGHSEMVEHLSSLTTFDDWDTTDKVELFVACTSVGMYVLAMVISLSTSQEFGNTLEERFTSTTRANVLNLKLELQSMRKGNESITFYLQRIKTVRDKLSTVGVHTDYEELLHVATKEEAETPSHEAEVADPQNLLPLIINSSLNLLLKENLKGLHARSTGKWVIMPLIVITYELFLSRKKNPTTELAAMPSASNSHHTQNAETWLTDFGASDHIIVFANNLSPQVPYQGQV